MFNAATLGFALDLAHKAGRDRRVMDAAEITRIIATAKSLAQGGLMAEVLGDAIAHLAPPAAEEPSTNEDDLQALLTIRNDGPSSIGEVAVKLGWRVSRSRSAILRLSAPGFVEGYDGGYHTVTDKGRDRLMETGMVDAGAAAKPLRDAGACRFPK